MRTRLSTPRQGGSAVVVMLALLALVLVFVSANMRSLASLESEMKLIERKQTRRLEAHGATNVVASPLLRSDTNAPASINAGGSSLPD